MIAPHRAPGKITLAEATVFIAETTGCRRPHINTVLRWATKGVRGTRLHAIRVGRTFWTTREAVIDFVARMNASPLDAASPMAVEVVRHQREEHAKRVRMSLAEELGIVEQDEGGVVEAEVAR